MKTKIVLFVFICLLQASINSFAGIPFPYPSATEITTSSKSQTETENRACAGLVWTLQEQMSWVPDLTIGFRSLRVKSSDSVSGGEISARIKLKDGISFDSTRLSYVRGERDVLGNIGFGYSVTNSSFLGTVAVQGAHIRLGTDYQLSGKKLFRFWKYLQLINQIRLEKYLAPQSLFVTTLCSQNSRMSCV